MYMKQRKIRAPQYVQEQATIYNTKNSTKVELLNMYKNTQPYTNWPPCKTCKGPTVVKNDCSGPTVVHRHTQWSGGVPHHFLCPHIVQKAFLKVFNRCFRASYRSLLCPSCAWVPPVSVFGVWVPPVSVFCVLGPSQHV